MKDSHEANQILNKAVYSEKQGRKSDSEKNWVVAIIAVIIISLPLLLCSVTTLVVFYTYSTAVVTENSDSNLYRVKDDYIEPNNVENLPNEIALAEDQFPFTFEVDKDPRNYAYERRFLLLNLSDQNKQLEEKLGTTLIGDVDIILMDDQDEFENLQNHEYNYDLSYAGFTTESRIIFFLDPAKTYDKQGLKTLISHELVHVYQFNVYGYQYSLAPDWFEEGTAEYYSGSILYPLTYYDVAPKLSSLEEVDQAISSSESDEIRSGYIVSYHFIHYLASHYPEEYLIALIANDNYIDFETNFYISYGKSTEDLFQEWRETQD